MNGSQDGPSDPAESAVTRSVASGGMSCSLRLGSSPVELWHLELDEIDEDGDGSYERRFHGRDAEKEYRRRFATPGSGDDPVGPPLG